MLSKLMNYVVFSIILSVSICCAHAQPRPTTKPTTKPTKTLSKPSTFTIVNKQLFNTATKLGMGVKDAAVLTRWTDLWIRRDIRICDRVAKQIQKVRPDIALKIKNFHKVVVKGCRGFGASKSTTFELFYASFGLAQCDDEAMMFTTRYFFHLNGTKAGIRAAKALIYAFVHKPLSCFTHKPTSKPSL